jgi:FAD binding domain
VVDAVNLTRKLGLEVAIRGGGHNVAGRATIDGGVMIDLAPMKGVGVNDTAFSHRSSGHNFLLIGEWVDPKISDRCIAWARETHADARVVARLDLLAVRVPGLALRQRATRRSANQASTEPLRPMAGCSGSYGRSSWVDPLQPTVVGSIRDGDRISRLVVAQVIHIAADSDGGLHRRTVTLPKPMTSGAKSAGRFGKQDFVYLADENVYRCPAGEKLKYYYTNEENGQKLHAFGRMRAGPAL